MKMTTTRTMYLRRQLWICLLTVAMLPAIAQAAVKGKPIKARDRRRSLQGPNLPGPNLQGPILQGPSIPSNIFQDKGKGGKGGKGSSKAETIKTAVDCVEEPTPTSSSAPTKVKKTKNPTHSPAPSITASPTKGGKAKTKSPVAPTVSPRPTYTQKPTKYPKYCSEEPTLSQAPAAAPNEPTVVAPSTATGSTTTEPTMASSTSWPNCNAIAAGTATTDLEVVNFSVDFLIVMTGNVEETLERIEQFLQQNVATVVAGCTDTRRRRLQDAANIVNVKFDVEEDTGAFCSYTDIGNGVCVGVDVNADIYHTGGNTGGFRELLWQNIFDKCAQMKALEGVADIFDPCALLKVTRNTPDDDTDDNGAVAGAQAQQTSDDEGLGAGGFVAVAGTSLLVLLFLLLFARHRRNDEYLVKHHQLEDTGDDDTYLRDIDGQSDPSSPGSVYDNRRSYIIGDEDTIMSGWSHTKNGDDDSVLQRERPPHRDGGLGDLYGSQNVHKCSSATCDICERERQSGLQFIPSGMPSHTSLPLDLSRDYLSSDTVEL